MSDHTVRPGQTALASSSDETRALLGDADTALVAPSLDGRRLSSSARLVPGERVGRYIVLHTVGSGGMGEVYAAYDPELDRKLALKLLRMSSVASSGTEGRARLLREAQAMARLSHPNVVTVHDVGTFREQVFVAMEFVEGCTLREWNRKKRHGWKEVLEIFRQAGRGLAAAHAAGLVHRDFKPDNVLIADEGRVVRVADFGLARPATSAQDPRSILDRVRDVDAVGSTLDGNLTRTGAVLGTPAYMAPEQHSGGATDARTDQFSYCVALYEALYHERPFEGETMAAVSQAVAEGRIREPPRDSKVPLWLRRVLLRGLAQDPAARYPSMAALLAELGRDRTSRRRRIVGAIALLAAVGGSIAAYFRTREDPAAPCRMSERKLIGVWDAERKRAGKSAFIGTGKPYASRAWSFAAQALNRYTRDWVAMHTDACEATNVRGEQSEELLDLRMECLEKRLQQMEALTSLFLRADAKVVESGISAVRALPTLGTCADLEALRARVPLPKNRDTRARVASLKAKLAEATALRDAGKYHAGLEVVRPIVAAAEALDYRPIRAEALSLLGHLQNDVGDRKSSEESLQRAIWEAEAGRHDKIAAQAAARLVCVVAVGLGQYARAEPLAHHAAAAIERFSGDEEERANLLVCLGAIGYNSGRIAQAIEYARAALAIRERLYGADDVRIAVSLGTTGTWLAATGQFDEALRLHQRALAIRERSLGPDHPRTGVSLHFIARVYLEAGRYAEAETALVRARAIREAALGPENPRVAATFDLMGAVARARAHYGEALEYYERTLRIREKADGEEHPETALARSGRSMVLHNLGRDEEALAEGRRALATLETTLGHEHAKVAIALRRIGLVLDTLGHDEQAASALERALVIEEKSFGRESGQAARTRMRLAAVLAELDRLPEAREAADRSIATLRRVLGPQHPSMAWALVARGRVRLAGDQIRAAREDARGAQAIFENELGKGHPNLARALEVEAMTWQREREHGKALPLLERARGIWMNTLGPDHPRLARALVLVGESQFALGMRLAALDSFERAFELVRRRHNEVLTRARAQFGLARALWPSVTDRDRARRLAREARATFAESGPMRRDDLARVEAFLAAAGRSAVLPSPRRGARSVR